MSVDDLMNCADGELRRFAAAASAQDLHNLFNRIWERVRPLYAGQPKSAEAAQGLFLAQSALSLASEAHDPSLLIEAWHMMGRSLSANEEFEKAIPFYRQVISKLEERDDIQQAARLRLALIGVLLNADRYEEAFEVARVAEKVFEDKRDDMEIGRAHV